MTKKKKKSGQKASSNKKVRTVDKAATASVTENSNTKNDKQKNKSGMQKPLKVFIVLMIILAIIVMLWYSLNSCINTKPNTNDTNAEAAIAAAEGHQVLPTGFVFAEEKKGSDGSKSAIEGFVDFITGKNKQTSTSTSDKSGTSKDGSSSNKGTDNTSDLQYSAQVTPDSLHNVTSVNRKEDFYNFLVIAKDKSGMLTDTMMVVSFDVPNEAISVLQLPRDTSVNYNDNLRKLNSVYGSGYKSKKGSEKEKVTEGIKTLNTVIVQNFGIVIDRYVIIDIEGFREIVDTIGGVDVYVQEDMVYKDDYQNLDINLKKGMNHLDGKKAEQFVRFRKGYINQDLGRIDAQKIFMAAFLDKLFSKSSIIKIPELIGHFMEYVTTDVTLQEATYLGTRLLDMGMSGITMHTLQGTAGSNTYVNGASYFSPYKLANIDLVNKYFNVFNKDLGPDNVNPRMIIKEPGNGKYKGGKTAEEIEKDNPDLKFSR